MSVLAALLLLVATGASAQDGQVSATPAPQSAADEEFAAHELLAVQMLDAVHGKDPKRFAELLDSEGLVDRAIAGLRLDSAYQKGYRSGSTWGIKAAWTGDLQDLADETKWSLAFVRVRGTPGARSLLFRMRKPSSSWFAYVECWTAPGADGRWRFVDWVSHVNGERKCERIRRELLTSTVARKRPDPGHLSGVDREYYDHAGLVRQLLGSVPREKWPETLAQFEGLPAGLRQDASLQLAELRFASWLGDAERVRACYERFVALHPENPTADLWAFAHDLWGADKERVLASVRRLRTLLGGDSHLDYIESDLLVSRGELESARDLALRARSSEPDWLDPYWLVVSIALKRHNQEDVLQALLELDGHFEVEWHDLSEQEAYKEFVASPLHAEWLKHLAGHK